MKKSLVLSNSIVWASHRLSIEEMKLARFMYSQMGEDGIATFPLENLSCHWLKIDRQSLFEAAYNVVVKPIKIVSKDDDPIFCSWASYFQVDSKGNLIIKFSEELQRYSKPYRAFIVYDYHNILELKTSYSLQLYEFLKSMETRGILQDSVEQLKERFGISNMYTLYADFKRKILIPAVDEVSERTDMSVEFQEIKEARKVISIRFLIKPKKDRQLTIEDVSRAVIDTSRKK